MSLQDELHPTSGSPLHEASQSSSLGEKAETLPEQGGPAPSPPGSPSDSQRTVAWQPPSGSEAAFPQIEGYQIIGRLGEGGMGVVWKAVQHGTHRTVALKLMNAASFGSQRAEQRFQREVDLTAALEHPSIARVYDGGQRGGVYFYAMELIDGQPLDRYVKHAGLSQRAIVELMLAVCEAVEFAHRKGVVHRDLKPANILVDKEGRPHVVDFGLAKALRGDDGSALTQDGGTVGTPCYMSPEQAAGDFEHLGAPSDVYSLGVVLFRLLTGEFPHHVQGRGMEVMRRIIDEEPRRLRQVAGRADRDLEAVLMKALERAPERRYATAGGLAADLQRYLKGEPLVARRPTVSYLLRKRLWKYRKSITVAAIILALAGMVAGYAAWDWYAQWGDWIEVARYDFTRPDATLEGLEFRSFLSALPVPSWPLDGDGLHAKWGEWCVLKDVHVRGDVRLVLKVRYNAKPDGIDLCINSVMPPRGNPIPVGYSAQAGGYDNTVSFISRNEGSVYNYVDTVEGVAATLPTGRTVTLTFQRQGENLLLEVDGRAQVRQTELLPLTGAGTEGAAIRNWASNAVVESLAIYRRSMPRKAGPLVAADALVEVGQLLSALGQYVNVADDYRDSRLGELALAKACRLSAIPHVTDTAMRQRLRQRFAQEYPRSPFRAPVLAADALSAWQEQRYEEALAGLDDVRALDPQTRLAQRFAAASRSATPELPTDVAQRLMTELGRINGVTRLVLDGLGIDRLDGIGNLQLYGLGCSWNPIESLEPIRGSPLADLFCQDTRVASLEPLRGKPLQWLEIARSRVSDLSPLRGSPLKILSCADCPIDDLGPLREMTSLDDELNVSRTRIKSIEPLAGLPLKRLNIESTAISDLSPLRGVPLEQLDCSNCRLTNLDALRGAPLGKLYCDRNQIGSLESLRGMGLQVLSCSRNRITSLEPLRGMVLAEFHVDDNRLTTLEPLVASPPIVFTFDCPGLPDTELQRVRDIWNAKPQHCHHAHDAEVLLAMRHHDAAALARLASVFQGHRYLLVPKCVTWAEASALCRNLGGHQVTITSPEENDFVDQLLVDCGRPGPFIGLHRQNGQTTWETAEPVRFTKFCDLLAARGEGEFGFIPNVGWVLVSPGSLAPFIVEWDRDPTADAKHP